MVAAGVVRTRACHRYGEGAPLEVQPISRNPKRTHFLNREVLLGQVACIIDGEAFGRRRQIFAQKKRFAK